MARILIADDDELVVDVVRAALEARGHIVGALPDGKLVKKVLEAKRPDLLILDRSMPEVSGLEVLRLIRGSAEVYGIPVLMLTAASGAEDEEIALRAGADDYLRKPFDPDQLVAWVEARLERAASRKVEAPGRRPV